MPRGALPEVVDTHGAARRDRPTCSARAIPITGLAGDQQAATIGQGCLSPGETKATYGTGAFVLANMGAALPRSRQPPARHRADASWTASGRYALEGSVFVAGSLVQWLRDSLGLIASAAETEALAALGARQRRGGDRARAVGPRRAALAARGARG